MCAACKLLRSCLMEKMWRFGDGTEFELSAVSIGSVTSGRQRRSVTDWPKAPPLSEPIVQHQGLFHVHYKERNTAVRCSRCPFSMGLENPLTIAWPEGA